MIIAWYRAYKDKQLFNDYLIDRMSEILEALHDAYNNHNDEQARKLEVARDELLNAAEKVNGGVGRVYMRRVKKKYGGK